MSLNQAIDHAHHWQASTITNEHAMGLYLQFTMLRLCNTHCCAYNTVIVVTGCQAVTAKYTAQTHLECSLDHHDTGDYGDEWLGSPQPPRALLKLCCCISVYTIDTSLHARGLLSRQGAEWSSATSKLLHKFCCNSVRHLDVLLQ